MRVLALSLLIAVAAAHPMAKPALRQTKLSSSKPVQLRGGASIAPPRQTKLTSSKLVQLRGGGSIGPVGATELMKVNCVMYFYFVSLFGGLLAGLPSGPFMGGDPFEKFGWGEPNKPVQTQLVAALTYFGLLLIKDTFFLGAETHAASAKALCYAWAVCAAAFNYGTYVQGCTFTEANVLSVLMTLAYAYIVWG